MIDSQFQELYNHFNEVSMELLLLCVICLNPINSFSTYDKKKLFQFVEFYPKKFSVVELITFEYQLDNYILNMCFNNQFFEIIRVTGFTKKLVQLKKYRVYLLVYLLVKLTLLLSVTIVESIF